MRRGLFYLSSIATVTTAGIFGNDVGTLRGRNQLNTPVERSQSKSIFDFCVPKVHAQEKHIGQVLGEVIRSWSPFDNRAYRYKNHLILYDQLNKIPRLTFEHFTKDQIITEYDRKGVSKEALFQIESRLKESLQTRKADYRCCFQVGMLVSAENQMHSHPAWKDTFYTTNFAPMRKLFKEGVWLKLERAIRKNAQHFQSTYVISGPLLLPKTDDDCDSCTYMEYEVLGKSNTAVPTHFFKLIYYVDRKGRVAEECYIIPHDEHIRDKDYSKYFIGDKKVLECKSGLALFPDFGCN